MIFFARWTPAIYWSLVSKPVSQDIQSICYCLHTGIFRLDTYDLVVAGVPISISSKYLYLYLALKLLTLFDILSFHAASAFKTAEVIKRCRSVTRNISMDNLDCDKKQLILPA